MGDMKDDYCFCCLGVYALIHDELYDATVSDRGDVYRYQIADPDLNAGSYPDGGNGPVDGDPATRSAVPRKVQKFGAVMNDGVSIGKYRPPNENGMQPQEQISFNFDQVAATLEALRIAGFISNDTAENMNLDAWLTALLSGEYEQTHGQLGLSKVDIQNELDQKAEREAAALLLDDLAQNTDA